MCLTDKILGIEKGERIDKRVKSELIQKASDQLYSKYGNILCQNISALADIKY